MAQALNCYSIVFAIIIHVISIQCDVTYIFPSFNRSGCPFESNCRCISLLQISDQSFVSYGSNATLLFLPGIHTLASTITVKHYTYFTMKSISLDLQKPVINCQNSSNFQFISVASVSIDSLKFSECLDNRVYAVDKLMIIDSILEGTVSLSGRGLVATKSTIYVTRSLFSLFNSISPHNGNEGGAITLIGSDCIISDSNITDNTAYSGSAIFGDLGTTINIIGSIFRHNKAEDKITSLILSGGTIHCDRCNLTIHDSSFEHNKAKFGGAIFVYVGIITIKSATFLHNMAEFGGALYAIHAINSYLYGSITFKHNIAHYGAAAIFFLSTTTIDGELSVINNTAKTGVIGIVHSTVFLARQILFSNNVGSIFVYNGEVTIKGKAIISNNNQLIRINFTKSEYTTTKASVTVYDISSQGGGITLFVSRLILQGSITLMNNTASNGGGILAITSTIYCACNLQFMANTASDTGGGLYLYQSELSISDNGHVTINDNRATKHGGGIHAISAFIKLVNKKEGQLKFHPLNILSNIANMCGGGVYFEAGSKLYVLEYQSNDVTFFNNTADYGGAVYIADDTNVGACFNGEIQTITTATQSECFFQISTVKISIQMPRIHKAITFSENHAKYSGADLYGGLLDRCIISAFGRKFKYSSIKGYVRYLLNSTTSKAVRLCPCNISGKIECDSGIMTVNVTKNEKFTIKVAAVDHVNHTMNATVFSYVTDNQASLGEEQTIQTVGATCSDVVFSIVSPKAIATLIVYAEGPCKDLGISPLRVVVNFNPCSCPLGFEQNKAIKNKCICICHHKLKQTLKSIMDTNCNSTTLLLTRDRDFWISYTSNSTLITYEYCPPDYCFPPFPAIFIDLSTLDGVDAQCKLNRTGILCGRCELGLTLSLGSSRCIECPHYWSALFFVTLLSAILAGIVVIISMLALRLTVATGTLNAMIFYANIMHLGSNQGLFLPLEHPNFVSIFVAWLNLDIGFDVCFFKGLDMYFKQWLQLIFPTYLILLVIAVIIACNLSSTFAKLIGKQNPVATLGTLILLSYTRLLNNTIDILSFATLRYTPMDENDSFKETVWLTDASIPYLRGKHIPLFIVAILILLVGLPYTILLTFWQWFIRLPNRTPFNWVRNAKLASFMDVYHAPYIARNRYWTGLLLLARVVLFLTAAINVSGEPRVNYLAVSLVVGSIFLLRTYSGMRTYKKWVLDIFEFTTYFNILALVVTMFYVLQPHNTTITSVSVGFQLAIFLCILTYHIVVETNILKWIKGSKLYKTQFHHDITASLLDNEPQTQQTNQLVTYSEITIENQRSGVTSKAKVREDVITLFSE